jgi:ATP-dependent exoDNAse (exonuclease V) alpha subunit
MVQEDFKNENDLLRHIMTVDKNVEQGRALKKIFTTRENLFITGRAGSGKSTFMRRIVKFLGKCVIVAPTGVAALNAGGQTIHSFFSLKSDPYIPSIERNMLSNKIDLNNFVRSKVKNLDTIVIDEVSMVRPDLLDEVADILRQSKRSKEPFGGVRLIMFGDLSQLPPVVTDDDFVDKYYESRFFFSSKALRASGYSVITFNKVFRQKDPRMISVLEDIRCGNISDDTREILESRVKSPDNMDNTVFICSTNKEVSDINNSNLSKIDGDVFKFKASIDGDRPQAPCEDELMVKIGAKVIITRNGAGYVNGSVGVITDIDDDVIYVKLSDGTEVDISMERWEKIRYRMVDGEMEKIVCGSIYQFPIRLGYAITSHKSQGMTLDSVYIDMGRAFEAGQVYTAMSRCKSLDGLYLKQVPDDNSIVLSDKVQDFMDRIEEMDGEIPPERISDIGKDMIKKKQDLFNFDEYGL